MLNMRGALAGLTATWLALGLWNGALAAEIKLTNVGASEDAKHVKLTFSFSEPVKPDVTYFYTHNYVGLRATGLQFSSSQLRQEVPPPSADAARTYRTVRFVQDRESGEIRLYLTKPLTPADAQVVPYDTYTEVTLLKPAGQSKPMAPAQGPGEAASPQGNAEVSTAVDSPEPAVAEPTPGEATADDSETPPTLRTGTPDEYLRLDPEASQGSAVQSEPAETEQAPLREPVKPGRIADQQPPVEQPSEEQAGSDPVVPQAAQQLGGPSYKGFDLDKVPVNQLVFKGKPFREALMELVGDSGYNIVIADDVDNSEVTLNFAQKQLSLKSALDLLAQAFDLSWNVEDDAIVVKAKPQP